MGMYQTTDFRKGLKLELEGKPYLCLEATHTNPGKGSAFVRVRIKNLESGAVIERTFKVGTETACFEPDLEEKEMAYMYTDGEGVHFMDQSNYESIYLTPENVGDAKGYLKEGIVVQILYYKGRPISIELPHFVGLKVVQTDAGLKGDTATGGSKKAMMETGLQVNVPLFIKEGELLKIDTRDASYVERMKE